MFLSKSAREALQRLKEIQTKNALALFCPTPGQQEFERSLSRLRALIAANQVGKTIAGAVETWRLSTETHPYRIHHKNKMGEGWICVANWGKGYESVAKKLYETCPYHLVDWSKTHFESHGHWRNNRIVMLNGFVIKFVSSKGSSTSGASGSIDWLWIDEPPKRHQMGELLARTSAVNGPIWFTLTPCDSEQDLTWLQHYIEGDPETDTAPHGDWHVIRITYTPENVPWKSAEEIEEQTSLYPPWEYNQRVLGLWEGITHNRRFASFNEQCVVGSEYLPNNFDEIRIGIDHGEGMGKQCIHLIGYQKDFDRYWVIGEYTSSKGDGLREHVEGLLGLLAGWSLTIYDVDEIYGDINSSGLLGGGFKYNVFLEKEIAKQLKLRTSPKAITTPNKGRGSVGAGESAINHAMKEGRFFVHAACKALIHSLKHYTGKEQDLKDPVDSTRYAIADILLSPHIDTDQEYTIR